MAAFAWSLTAASASLIPGPALAQTRSISIPPGPLGEAMRRLSDETGVSIGFSGQMPTNRTRPVHDASSPEEALRQMLAGTGLRAVRTGPSTFRIERAVSNEASRTVSPPPRPPQLSEPEILVTAFKRPQSLSSLPATDQVVRPDELSAVTGLPASETLSREIPSLTVTDLGAGRNRLFLRGIGDGPLNGFAQGSVATLLDDARLNYDGPDPDWALIDIDRVEVVEGPQGPLYGTGALGGIVRILTNAPNLSHLSGHASAGMGVTQDSGLSDSESMMINMPLVSDRLGIRAVGYRESTAGWIDNAGGKPDLNRERLTGGRVAVRWSPARRWTMDIVGAAQNRRTADSQYVDGNLGSLVRPDRLAEPRDVDSKLAMITLNGPIGGLEATSITSISTEEALADYDATPLAPLLGTTGATLVRDDRQYRVFDQEIRLRNPQVAALDWLAGLSLVRATTDATIVARDESVASPLLTLKRSITEAAAFGEASVALTPHLKLGAGARIFSTAIDDEGHQGEATLALGRRAIRPAGDLSLTWNPASGTTVYIRAATGYRPGGVNPEGDATQNSYLADELATIESGARIRLFSALSLGATFYATIWRHVQADELLATGLVATRNAGNARNIGIEATARWALPSDFTLTGAVMIQSARLDPPGELGIEDRRLPAVPEAAARLLMRRGLHWGPWRGNAGMGIRYVGATHMSFDPLLDRRTRGHATLDASLSLSRGAWTVALVGENLTDSRADTFAFGNPFRVLAEPQRTPARPLSIGITIGRSF